jgi:hypothetical protein
MNISGRADLVTRNYLISSQVLRYYREGEKVDDAVDRVQAELIEIGISLKRDRVYEIYRKRDQRLDYAVETALHREDLNILDYLRK